MRTNRLFFDLITNLTEIGTGTKEQYICVRNMDIIRQTQNKFESLHFKQTFKKIQRTSK